MGKTIINIFGKETVKLVCNKCGNSREIPVTCFSAEDNRYKVRCKCGSSYTILLERRKFNRKKTDLRGSYAVEKSSREEIVDIMDLSTTGLCFVRRDNRALTKGQVITITFALENSERDEIKSKAIIRQVKDKRIGIEFLDLPSGMKRILSFYLFNYTNHDTRVQEINFPILPAD